MVDAQMTDAEYLKSNDLGLVIAKGMAVMYKAQPTNPVDFLARWLLNLAANEKKNEDMHDQIAIVQMQLKQHAAERAELNTQEQERKKGRDHVDSDKRTFTDKIQKATDLSDHIQDLTSHLQKYSNASAVYIGKLIQPKKAIKDGDDDFAHIDDSGEKIIHFSHSNEEHSFMVDKILAKGTGLTFDVFNDKVDDEGNKVVQDTLEHLLVKEVVREPRIHFFQVPRLGSYLAIRLEYNSCLFVEAYNDGIKDALSIQKRKLEQEEQKKEHEEKERDRRDDCEANDQDYVYDAGEWEEIISKQPTTQKQTFVVCLNTMGQDREFKPQEVSYALEMVKFYRDEWERIEAENLQRDIDRKISNMEAERIYKEVHEAIDIAESEKRADEATQHAEGQEPMDEFQKGQTVKKAKWDILTKMFYDPEGAVAFQKNLERERVRTNTSADRIGTPNTSAVHEGAEEKYTPLTPEYWKQPFLDIRQLNVIKMPRALQSLFYLLGYTREQVCETDTNKLDFKKVKTLINEDLFEKMAKYNPFGQRESSYKEYQKLAFLKRSVESIEEEKVDEYSIVLGRIYRWVSQAIELRVDDVRHRRDTVANLKHEREQAVAEDKARTEKRNAALEDKQAEHEVQEEENSKKFLEDQDSNDEDGNPVEKMSYNRTELNIEEFNLEFDTNNPPIDIPNEVADHFDNDYDLPYSAPDLSAE